jgi:phosphatidylserine/phosphatidylglycerophosphate/cardiolipin synthase-like enzyme
MNRKIFALFCLFLLAFAQDPTYDHQVKTYTANYQPVTQTNVQGSLTPFFSPVHSAKELTKLIENAKSNIDIGTPGWDSWSNCTQFTGPVGCSVAFVRNSESFPIFQALLNAIFRGVKVRILTNYYGVKTATGMITPLDFLSLAGAQVRYYRTTTFMHAKYMNADNDTASSSSVNYSYTSFMENREAGFIIQGNGFSSFFNFFSSIFEFDWNEATAWPIDQTYNSTDMAIIKNTSPVKVVIPPPRNISGSYVPPLVTVTHTFSNFGLITSPDYACTTVMAALQTAQTSIAVQIYQITPGPFCNFFISKFNAGLNVTILVSDEIFSYDDYEQAKACYTSMYNAGLVVRKTKYDMFKYTHAKFWIIDGQQMFLSTGNLGATDYPSGSNVFPPYGQSGWRDTNRDFTVQINDPTIINIFQDVINGDWKTGHNFYPLK